MQDKRKIDLCQNQFDSAKDTLAVSEELYEMRWNTNLNICIRIRRSENKTRKRLYDLLTLQNEITQKFGEDGYNVFVFGSYLTTKFEEGSSDIDIAIYAEDFDLYKRIAIYLEEYYNALGIPSDIFFIDLTMQAPIYCAPLKSKVQFTDYFPQKLADFEKKCEQRLEEVKARMAG